MDDSKKSSEYSYSGGSLYFRKVWSVISDFFYRFTIQSLLLIFAIGVAIIFFYIDGQQNKMLQKFQAQQEGIYKAIEKSMPGTKLPMRLNDEGFEETQANLHQVFFILISSLGVYLLLLIFVIHKLKLNSKQLQLFTRKLQTINKELKVEVDTRGKMAKRLEELNKEFKYQSTHDSLTNLPNRRLFQDRLEIVLATSKRKKLIFAVMLLDLDGFKFVNDTLGHDAGDELLVEVAKRLQNCDRKMDTVARLGGDEFAFIFTELDRPESSAALADRILNALEKKYFIKNQEVHIGGSIGITIYPDDSDISEVLVKNADVAMYHAKSLGRGNFQYFKETMNIASKKQLKITNSFQRALTENSLEMFYQPIVDVKKHEVISYEALLRWNDPELGEISPREMLKLSNHLGIQLELSYWTLGAVCKQINEWDNSNFRVPSISINATILELESREFVQRFKDILSQHNVSGDRLILEISESVLLSNTERVCSVLKDLNMLGVRIAIDDFGAGYSSIGHLKKFPVQILKMDRSFINEANGDGAIVHAIVMLAQALHLEIIAEGVETKDQLNMLTNQGCYQMQGYFFGKAVPAEECVNKAIFSGD